MTTIRRKAGVDESAVGEPEPSAPLSPASTCSHPAPVTPGPSKNVATAQAAQSLAAEVFDWERLGSRGELYFALQMAFILLALFPPSFMRTLVHIVGMCMVVLGAVLMVTAGFNLGGSLTPVPQPRDVHTLVTDGVYAFCRHPMYGSGLVALAGLALATGSEARAGLVAILFFVLNKKASLEERYLEERYGDEYREYKSRTPKLIPWPF